MSGQRVSVRQANSEGKKTFLAMC